jgi:hypothetical protein
LYDFDDDVRYLEAKMALAWAAATDHELVYHAS